MNPKISPEEHCQRLKGLQRKVKERELDMFIVTSFESIFYLTGAVFEPLKRPFFLLVEADGPPALLVPKLDQEHMAKAHGIEKRNIITYREYPATTASSWPSRLNSCTRHCRTSQPFRYGQSIYSYFQRSQSFSLNSSWIPPIV